MSRLLRCCVVLLLVLAACGARQRAPAWVATQGIAVNLDNVRVFYGYGFSKGDAYDVRHEKAADQYARTEVYRQFRMYLLFMMERYRIHRASTHSKAPVGGWSKLMENYRNFADSRGWRTYQDKHLAWLAESLEERCVKHTTIADRYFDPKTGGFFSLARLDLKNMIDVVDFMDKVKPGIRTYFHDRAVHTRLEMLSDDLAKRGIDIEDYEPR